MGSGTKDEFVFSYSVLAAVLAFLYYFRLSAVRMFPMYPLVEQIAYVFLLVWLLKIAINSVRSIRNQHWHHLASIVAAPLLAAALVGSLHATETTPEWIRLQIFKASYLNEVNLIRDQDHPAFRRWYWGGTGNYTGPEHIVQYLVYDESGEIALPANQRSAPWRERTKWKDNGVPYQIENLEGHFFCLTTIYPS